MACLWFVLVAMEPVKIFGRPRSIIHFSSKHSDSQLIILAIFQINLSNFVAVKLFRFRYFEEHDMRELHV